jgi:hypothetical protein
MANHVLLNNIDHKNLKIITERSASYGDQVMSAITFPMEFRNLQSHYPIVFRKDAKTDDFHPVALFGFEKNENLFLTDDGWDSAYIPLTMECQAFLIGFQSSKTDAEIQAVVHIDMDNPRVNQERGQAVFLEHGGNSEYLRRISSSLKFIHHGCEQLKPFIAMLQEHQLLEPFAADIKLDDGSDNRLIGFYTINEEKLDRL